MLVPLFTFESRYHFNQLTFHLTAVLFLGLGVLCAQGNFGSAAVHMNAPYTITFIIGLLSLFTIFATTLFCANVVLRDTTFKTDAVIYATAIGRFPYFTVRFLGLLMTVFLLLCFVAAGIACSTLLSDTARLGTFHIMHYMQPLLVMGLPNALFQCAVIFCTAMLTRNVRAVYMAGVLLYILYSIASILGNSPLFAGSALKTGNTDIWPLLTDPFGLAIFLGDTRTWTAAQRNELLFPLNGVFLLNRLLWTLLSILLLVITYSSFSFRLRLSAEKKKEVKGGKAITGTSYSSKEVTNTGYNYQLSTFNARLKLEVLSVFRHIPFLVMMTMWVFVFSIELKDTLFNGAYGMRYYPATGLIVEALRSINPAMILIIFYAAELISRERQTNIQSLVYSTPVSNTAMWGAKCAALGVLCAAIVLANICIGAGMQIYYGYLHIDIPCYLSLFYYSALPLFLFAGLALFIQTTVSNKYLGMLLNMVVTVIILFSRRLGIEHYLLRYASVPEMNYSDMNGFGHYANAYGWYMLYWLLFAVILAMLTIRVWQRSLYSTRPLSVIFRRPLWLLVFIPFSATGAFIFYRTNIQGRYKSSRESVGWQLRYEQQYRSMAHLPQPDITAVSTQVDLYPDEARYTVKGRYLLRNNSDSPVLKIMTGIDPEVNSYDIFLAAVKHMIQDPIFGVRIYELKKALLPGDTTSMDFSMEVIRSGFTPFNNEHTVVSNGTYIELEKYVPYLGYNARYECEDARARQEKSMPAYAPVYSGNSTYHLIDFETIISTAADQQIATVGTLQRSWKKGERHYFHYKTTRPVNFMFALSSARYATRKEVYKGINFSILHQADHNDNTNEMMQAMRDAVDYCSAAFGPCPLAHLTLAEIPQYKGAATAYPGIIFSAEIVNFHSNFNDSNKVNYAYGIAAHETAHQWWANILSPADQPGAAFLTESLAQYTAAMLMEYRYGKTHMRKYLKADNQLYFAMANPDAKEEPLSLASRQSNVYYQKATLAMYALKEGLGEKRMNKALRQLIQEHTYPHKKATTEDFISLLRKGASDREVKLIESWL